MEWEYVTLDEREVRGALLLVGVPSFGMVGPVAVRFLIEHLKMKPLGGFQSADLPPTSVAFEGVVTGPLQVFAHAEGGKVPLLVLNSDVALEPEVMMSLAGEVTRWARGAGVRLLVGLEGTPADPAAPHKTAWAASSLQGEPFLAKVKATRVHAAVTGFTAALLVRANRDKIPALGLFMQVENSEEDAAAAAALLRLVAPLLPQVPLAPAALAKQAEEVQSRLRAQKEQQADHARRLQEQVDRGYV